MTDELYTLKTTAIEQLKSYVRDGTSTENAIVHKYSNIMK